MSAPPRPPAIRSPARRSRPTWLRAALAVAQAQLTRTVRDRTFFFFLVALPVVLTLLLGLAIPEEDAPDARVGVAVDGAPDETAAGLVTALEGREALDVEELEDVEALGRALRRGVLGGGLVIPGDLEARLEDAGGPVTVMFLPGPGTGGAVTRVAVGDALADEGARLGAAALTAGLRGVPLDAALSAVDDADGAGLGLSVEQRGEPGQLTPGGFSHTAPATLVLFVFLNTLIAGSSLTDARRSGVARRLWASPVAPSAVLAGEGVAKLAVAVLQAGILVGVSAALFGVDWGDPLGVAAVVLLTALAATGLALLAGSLARTSEQVVAVGPGIGLGLAALGGAMWPLAIVPDWLARLAWLTPHGWAMEAFTALVSRGASLSELTGELLGLAVFAAVLLLAGLAAGRVALRRA